MWEAHARLTRLGQVLVLVVVSVGFVLVTLVVSVVVYVQVTVGVQGFLRRETKTATRPCSEAPSTYHIQLPRRYGKKID